MCQKNTLGFSCVHLSPVPTAPTCATVARAQQARRTAPIHACRGASAADDKASAVRGRQRGLVAGHEGYARVRGVAERRAREQGLRGERRRRAPRHLPDGGLVS